MPTGRTKRPWRKQTATTQQPQQKPLSIARGAPLPQPSGRDVTPLLPDAARAFLAALERAHAHVSEWLPTIDNLSATEAERTRASLAIMIEANSLADDIRDLAVATQADTEAQPGGKVARTVAKSFARRTVRQYV